MHRHTKVLAALGIGLVSVMGYAAPSSAQQNPVTAIDIALEPDATMIQHAQAANARLLKSFPKGFALDATHNPHVTMLQQFVRTADLEKLYGAVNKVLPTEKPTTWKLKAYNHDDITTTANGRAILNVLLSEVLHLLQTAVVK